MFHTKEVFPVTREPSCDLLILQIFKKSYIRLQKSFINFYNIKIYKDHTNKLLMIQ